MTTKHKPQVLSGRQLVNLVCDQSLESRHSNLFNDEGDPLGSVYDHFWVALCRSSWAGDFETRKPKVKVVINPTKAEQMTGLTAFASWQNPDLEAAMIQAFAINPRKERLIQLEVTADGIKAILEHVPS